MIKKDRQQLFWSARLNELIRRWEKQAAAPEPWLKDPELLHTWRTTYRRMLPLLDWGPGKARKALKKILKENGMKSLMRRSSAMRDRQVFIDRLQRWNSDAPLDLTPFIQFIQAEINQDLPDWINDWLTIRHAKPLAQLRENKKTSIPVSRLLIRDLRSEFNSQWDDWKAELLEIGKTPMLDWDVDRMHQLRIAGKQLRYLGEWWKSNLTRQQTHRLELLNDFHQAAGQLQDSVSQIRLLTELQDTACRKKLIEPILWLHGRTVGWQGEERHHLAVAIDRLLKPDRQRRVVASKTRELKKAIKVTNK